MGERPRVWAGATLAGRAPGASAEDGPSHQWLGGRLGSSGSRLNVTLTVPGITAFPPEVCFFPLPLLPPVLQLTSDSNTSAWTQMSPIGGSPPQVA